MTHFPSCWRDRSRLPDPVQQRVPVYDGERLFLHVFPAWAMLIGLGFGWLWDHVIPGRRGRIAIVLTLIAQGFGVVSMYPFGLSYYNMLVGGLPGAVALGLERTYWSDAIDNVLLDRLSQDAGPGASAALVPTLYPGQGAVTTGSIAGWRVERSS